MSEENGNEKKVEYEGIAVHLFPDWDGDRESRDYRVKAMEAKFECDFPVPTSDEEAQRFYAMSLRDLIAKGARQATYDKDGAVKNLVDGKTLAGVAPADYLEEFQSEFEEALSTAKEPRAKGGKAKAERKVGVKAAKVASELGITPDQLFQLQLHLAENPSLKMAEAMEDLGIEPKSTEE